MPEQADKTNVVEIQNLVFNWRGRSTPTISIPEWRVTSGRSVFLFGPSGSGKSTLIGLIGGVLAPGAGSLKVIGTELTNLKQSIRDKLRAEEIGFVFQLFNLIPYLSVKENILLPLKFSEARRKRIELSGSSIDSESIRLLESLGLPPKLYANRRASELSVGQQQRVAIARALLGAPKLIIADEPTSALDTDRREAFMNLLFNEVKRIKASLIFVSHDRSLSRNFDESVNLLDLNKVPVNQLLGQDLGGLC